MSIHFALYTKTAESPPAPDGLKSLISPENISRIHLIHHIIQTRIIPVRNDRLRHLLELIQIIHNPAPEECTAVLQSRLIHDHRCPLRLDPLHHALNRTLPEIIRIALHRQSVDTHDNRLLLRHIILRTRTIRPRNLQHPVRDKILPRPVRLHNRLNQILRHVRIIRQKLLRILRQTISAIPKTWVIVMRANSRIQTHPIYDLLCIQPFHLRISIELIEIRHPKRQICIREKLHRLRFRISHDQRVNILFDCAFLQKLRKCIRRRNQSLIIHFSYLLYNKIIHTCRVNLL